MDKMQMVLFLMFAGFTTAFTILIFKFINYFKEIRIIKKIKKEILHDEKKKKP